jgi:hypothetical protein
VNAACRDALANHSVSADVVLTLLTRARDPARVARLASPRRCDW